MAGPTAANCKLGPSTAVTINSVIYYTKGTTDCGIEGDVTFGTVDQHPVPFAAVYGSMQPFFKTTLAEIVSTVLDELWDVTADGVAPQLNDLTPTTKTPGTTTCSAVLAGGTFAITEAVSTDFGSISAGDGDNFTIDATFKGLDSNMSGGTGTWTDPV